MARATPARRVARWALVTVGLLVALTVTRAYWLAAVATFLVVDERVEPAPVIAVFAGGRGERAVHAAALFRRQLAPRILVTGGEMSGEAELVCRTSVSGADITARRLMREGVPRDALVVIPRGTSTFEEAAVVREYLAEHGYRSVIAVSSAYHMRRVRASLRHHLSNAVIAQVSAAHAPDFDVRAWWRDERGLLLVTQEYLKLVYYRFSLL